MGSRLQGRIKAGQRLLGGVTYRGGRWAGVCGESRHQSKFDSEQLFHAPVVKDLNLLGQRVVKAPDVQEVDEKRVHREAGHVPYGLGIVLQREPLSRARQRRRKHEPGSRGLAQPMSNGRKPSRPVAKESAHQRATPKVPQTFTPRPRRATEDSCMTETASSSPAPSEYTS